ncbi:MAG: BACON domain-containing protein [Prevotella sp.]|nr:BACON domain-containing protein [Prevotella sp.]MBR1461887.1 BACON domain-containing protein [Prevotella sp.]
MKRTLLYTCITSILIAVSACSEVGDIDGIIVNKEKSEMATYALSVDVAFIEFAAEGESKAFHITTTTSWQITAPAWCQLSTTSGTGNATITISTSENNTGEHRNDNIIIAGKNANTITIPARQNAKNVTSDIPQGNDNLTPQY